MNKRKLEYSDNLVATRGRVKKGPYMILKRISPLIYVLPIKDGKLIVVHVNRLNEYMRGQDDVETW